MCWALQPRQNVSELEIEAENYKFRFSSRKKESSLETTIFDLVWISLTMSNYEMFLLGFLLYLSKIANRRSHVAKILENYELYFKQRGSFSSRIKEE